MTVQALRITVTVRQGLSSFRLTTVVAPAQGGAKAVPASNVATTDDDTAGATTPSTNTARTATTPTTSSSAPAATANSPTTAVAQPVDLKYPFTFLEIRENDKTVPPAPSEEPTA